MYQFYTDALFGSEFFLNSTPQINIVRKIQLVALSLDIFLAQTPTTAADEHYSSEGRERGDGEKHLIFASLNIKIVLLQTDSLNANFISC